MQSTLDCALSGQLYKAGKQKNSIKLQEELVDQAKMPSQPLHALHELTSLAQEFEGHSQNATAKRMA